MIPPAEEPKVGLRRMTSLRSLGRYPTRYSRQRQATGTRLPETIDKGNGMKSGQN